MFEIADKSIEKVPLISLEAAEQVSFSGTSRGIF